MTADETHQRAEHVVEAASELGIDVRQVAEGRRDLEARENLA